MGQSHASAEALPGDDEDLSRYAAMGLQQIMDLIALRGISVPQRAGVKPDRGMMTALLLAYDAGVGSVGGSSAPSRQASPKPPEKPVCPTVLSVLQKIRDAPGHMGVDIGGTLIKIALALPLEVAKEYDLPQEFGNTGRAHHELDLSSFASNGKTFVLRFVSGSTQQMELAVQHLGLCRIQSATPAQWAALENHPSLFEEDEKLPGDEDDARRRIPVDAAEDDAREDDAYPVDVRFSRCFSDWSGEVFSDSVRPIRKIATSGGGACKFAQAFRDSLRVEIEPVKELSACVDGLLLLYEHHAEAGSTGGGDGEASDLFTVGENGEVLPLPWPDPLFPLILVSMGSGVSILRVDSAKDMDYVRVGGTACGGASFLGLARTLTSARTFDEALKLASGGDASLCDLLVSDIYGEEGCKNLGLPGGLTASNFGKLAEADGGKVSEKDLARALLQMVTQQALLLATAFAKNAGCLNRVFFVGGFVEQANWMSRMVIAKNFRALGGCAYFLRHSDFLGSLGSLKCALRALEAEGQHVPQLTPLPEI